VKKAEAERLTEILFTPGEKLTDEEMRDLGLWHRRNLRYDASRLDTTACVNATCLRQYPSFADKQEHKQQIERICTSIQKTLIPEAGFCLMHWPELEPAWTDVIAGLAVAAESLLTGKPPSQVLKEWEACRQGIAKAGKALDVQELGHL
jgi:hypothetical protein